MVLTASIPINPQPFLKFGYIGIFVFSLFGPGTLLFPSLAQYMNIPGLVIAFALEMVLNDNIGWLVGSVGYNVIPHSKKVERFEGNLRRHGPPFYFFEL